MTACIFFGLQDSFKVQEMETETENAAVAIADLEKEVEKLSEKLPEEEKFLEKIKESSKGIHSKFVLPSIMYISSPQHLFLIIIEWNIVIQ